MFTGKSTEVETGGLWLLLRAGISTEVPAWKKGCRLQIKKKPQTNQHSEANSGYQGSMSADPAYFLGYL